MCFEYQRIKFQCKNGSSKSRFDVIHSDQLAHGSFFIKQCLITMYVHRILLHYSTPSQLSWYLFKTRIFLHKIKEIGYQKKRFDVVDSDQLTHGRLFNYYTVYVHRILLLHSFVSIETVETKECMNILCRIIK